MFVELGILSISSISGLTLFSFITPVTRSSMENITEDTKESGLAEDSEE